MILGLDDTGLLHVFPLATPPFLSPATSLMKKTKEFIHRLKNLETEIST
jgi:hypothetical protein